jgi:hypothetical protein
LKKEHGRSSIQKNKAELKENFQVAKQNTPDPRQLLTQLGRVGLPGFLSALFAFISLVHSLNADCSIARNPFQIHLTYRIICEIVAAKPKKPYQAMEFR